MLLKLPWDLSNLGHNSSCFVSHSQLGSNSGCQHKELCGCGYITSRVIFSAINTATKNILALEKFFLNPDVDECSSNNGGCAQVCTKTPGSYTCGCDSGYELDGDGFSCNGTYQGILSPFKLFEYSDTDECSSNNGGCTQVCTNNPGSYTCGCDPGYELDGDGFSCNGT